MVEPHAQATELADREAPFVIALGASAGGLSALSAFCAALSEDIDAAIVVVPHLAPEQPSGMVRLLARQTDLPVRAMADGQTLQRGVIHVLVPGRLVRLEDGRLRLRIDHGGPLSMPIDRFLISMAADAGRRCAVVIMSGTGSDGVRGVRAVHRAGGKVLVQSPGDARFDGMPRAALASGVVDTLGTAPELARRLQETAEQAADEPRLARIDETLAQTLADQLTEDGGLDFHRYDPAVLADALRVRMAANGLAEVDPYLELLGGNALELEALRLAVLATPRRFFDDPHLFEMLGTRTLPTLLAQLGRRTEFRVWCVGCGTGESVYSLAMTVAEALEHRGSRGVDLRLFATDVEPGALSFAQDALYPATVVEEIGGTRADKHMIAEGESLRIRRGLRRHLIFARHDALRDPPFARLDLVICRGLLGRLRSPMQRRLLSRLHFALRDGGLLVLGEGETLGSGEFDLVDSRAHMYRRRPLTPNSEIARARFSDAPAGSDSTPETLVARLEASEMANEQLRALNAELQASLGELRSANASLQIEHERLSLLSQAFERTISEEQRLNRMLGTLVSERGCGLTLIDRRGFIRWVSAPDGLAAPLPLWAGMSVDDIEDARWAAAMRALVEPGLPSEEHVPLGGRTVRLTARTDGAGREGELLVTIQGVDDDGD